MLGQGKAKGLVEGKDEEEWADRVSDEESRLGEATSAEQRPQRIGTSLSVWVALLAVVS